MMEGTFELHFAAQEQLYPFGLVKALVDLGFTDDDVVEGAPWKRVAKRGVDTGCPPAGIHVTWKSTCPRDFKRKRQELCRILSDHSAGLVGYAHGEWIRPGADIPLTFKSFDPNQPFPLEWLDMRRRRVAKRWDLHISGQLGRLDRRLEDLFLCRAGFCYIDRRKKDGSVARVFTVQGANPLKDGLLLYRRLHEYLLGAGGIHGAIKFEQACFFQIYGEPEIVPPSITDFVVVD